MAGTSRLRVQKGADLESGGGRKTRVAIVVGVIALVVVAFVVGRSTSSSEGPAPEEVTDLSVVADPGAELETAYPRTKAGASLAAAAYQRAFADPAILLPGVLKKRIDAVATPQFAATMLEANTPGTERLMAGPVGEGVRDGVPTVYLGTPIAYRVLSFSPHRAQIQNWGFTLVGNAATVEPTAYFGTGTMELIWEGGRWRIADSQGAFGPTPETSTPEEGSEGFEMADLATDFKPYGLAP